MKIILQQLPAVRSAAQKIKFLPLEGSNASTRQRFRLRPCWQSRLALVLAAVLLGQGPTTASTHKETNRLFPENLPSLKWIEFKAHGFNRPVSGVIFHSTEPPCCGVPLGGVATGSLDVDVRGAFGFNNLFNLIYQEKAFSGKKGNVFLAPLTRKLPDYPPFLGVAIAKDTWVLADRSILSGGKMETCVDPVFIARKDYVTLPPVDGVHAAKQIDYWGHYPVVDMEYDLDPTSSAGSSQGAAPVAVALRAWSPFIPGDLKSSSSPCAFFEVRLRNLTKRTQAGTLAFSFPGATPPDAAQAFPSARRSPSIAGLQAVEVMTGERSFLLGVAQQKVARFGGTLGRNGNAWANIASRLPDVDTKDTGGSAAVDFSIEPGANQTTIFVLAWYAPHWHGDGDKQYTTMYSTRFTGSADVAEKTLPWRQELLRRVLAWQQEIYLEKQLPLWLRDTLVNNLCLIPETSYWAAAKPPLGDWCHQGGFYGMLESPRGCPQIECNPCTWYGNLPVVYFFPDLAHSTLAAHRHYMREDGAVPFVIGKWGRPDMDSVSYDWQISLNGPAYIMLVDRLWQATRNKEILDEFYPSIKKNLTMTMNLRPTPDGVISMPSDNRGMEWFEWGEWRGMCAHIGGLRLATAKIVERMAQAMGDREFAQQCRDWLRNGSSAMENKMWTGTYYLNFYEEESGKKSAAVMANQLDGEWAAHFHGFHGAFKPGRVPITLATIKRCNVPEAGCGAINFASCEGKPLAADDKVAEYGSYSMFLPEVMILGMTYIYAGDRDFGNSLLQKTMEQMVLVHRHPWDLPNAMFGDTGERQFGTDYYQNMMLWAAPAAYEGTDIAGLCRPGGLVNRIIKAGFAKPDLPVSTSGVRKYYHTH